MCGGRWRLLLEAMGHVCVLNWCADIRKGGSWLSVILINYFYFHHPSWVFKDSADKELSHSLVSRYCWSCSVMQKNARLQPLQAVIQVISCFCFHLRQISYQIFHWTLWRNCLHLTCKWHSKRNREEIKWNTLAERISRERLSTHQWSWSMISMFFSTMMHFSIV